MEELKFKQQKPSKVKLVGFFLLIFAVYLAFAYSEQLIQIFILFFVGLVLVGYNVTYTIKKSFKNKKTINLFEFPVMSFKLEVPFPEYISVFAASFSSSNEWGAVSALGKKGKSEFVVVRFFTGNKHFTVFGSDKEHVALNKGKELAELLEVELNNALES